MRTTDNNRGVALDTIKGVDESYDPEDLRRIADKKIGDIELDEYPNLLMFPREWNAYHDDVHESRIFSLSDANKLTTYNIMGFIGLDNTNLTITSRFSRDDTNDYFLHYMLQKVFAINVLTLQTSGGISDIWDFLLFFFPYFLNKALSQGLYKEYKRNEYNDSNVRGAVDVKRHLRANIPFSGRIAYSTREYSYNNPVLHIIRHTIEYIKAHQFGAGVLTADNDTKTNINQIMLATANYAKNDRQKIININRKKPVVHPYFTEYKALQRLCLRILCNEKISSGNEKERIHGLLFDGAWLWEEYLNTLLEKKGFKHPENKKKEGGYKLFDEGGRIYPDFISESPPPIIVDAKYKHLELNGNNENIDRPDYYQLMAYMYRFNSQKGCLVFPHQKENYINIKRISKGFQRRTEPESNTYNGEIVLLGLKIPQGKSKYSEFKETMADSERVFTKTIENITKGYPKIIDKKH